MRIFVIGLILQLIYFQGCTQKSAVTSEADPDTSELSPEEKIAAFPGAEGFGKYTTGGRGGKVYVVTNLNDEGPGSLREAIRKKEPRIIVFAVSGNIDLESSLDINYGNLTIAGQSAPGEGITLRNYPLKIKGDNVIVRYIRSRMGDKRKVQNDAISAMGNKNIIVDHCSFSWGTDENATFYDNENFTLQWSIVSESLNNSVHEKGEHGYGGIWGGKGASFHHNILAHNKSRNPRFNGARYHHQPELEIVDFRNNIIYNWEANSSYGGEEGNHNIVDNYYKSGPATDESKEDRIVEVWSPYGSYFVSGNIVDNYPEVTADNWKGVYGDHPDSALVKKPIPVESIPKQSAGNAYQEVLAHAGASYKRDAVDSRIMNEIRTGTATYGKEEDGIIDSQEDVGGWPELKTKASSEDKDHDGMSDSWEKSNGLDPANPNDHSVYDLDDKYTNIEVYLNELIEKNI